MKTKKEFMREWMEGVECTCGGDSRDTAWHSQDCEIERQWEVGEEEWEELKAEREEGKE